MVAAGGRAGGVEALVCLLVVVVLWSYCLACVRVVWAVVCF